MLDSAANFRRKHRHNFVPFGCFLPYVWIYSCAQIKNKTRHIERIQFEIIKRIVSGLEVSPFSLIQSVDLQDLDFDKNGLVLVGEVPTYTRRCSSGKWY